MERVVIVFSEFLLCRSSPARGQQTGSGQQEKYRGWLGCWRWRRSSWRCRSGIFENTHKQEQALASVTVELGRPVRLERDSARGGAAGPPRALLLILVPGVSTMRANRTGNGLFPVSAMTAFDHHSREPGGSAARSSAHRVRDCAAHGHGMSPGRHRHAGNFGRHRRVVTASRR
jgi:hypothetical protein